MCLFRVGVPKSTATCHCPALFQRGCLIKTAKSWAEWFNDAALIYWRNVGNLYKKKTHQVYFKMFCPWIQTSIVCDFPQVDRTESPTAVFRHSQVPSFAPQTQQIPKELVHWLLPSSQTSSFSFNLLCLVPCSIFLPGIQLPNLWGFGFILFFLVPWQRPLQLSILTSWIQLLSSPVQEM